MFVLFLYSLHFWVYTLYTLAREKSLSCQSIYGNEPLVYTYRIRKIIYVAFNLMMRENREIKVRYNFS